MCASSQGGSGFIMEKRRFRFSRLFFAIIGGIAFLLLAAYGWGVQTICWWKYREYAKTVPVLKLTPQEPPGTQFNPAQGMKLSHAGFEFEVPWTDLDRQKSKIVGNIAIYNFDSGRVLEFFGPGPDKEGLLSATEKSIGDTGRLRTLFGEEATKSDYAFRRTLLEQTPAKLKPWMNQREAIRVCMLLMIKGVASVGGETGLFKVEQHGWKGFQFDNPDKKPKRVTLELNDSNDQHIEIIFLPGKQGDAGLTQADVNRVLHTLKPLGEPSGSKIISWGQSEELHQGLLGAGG
jgi:hypothetical protein